MPCAKVSLIDLVHTTTTSYLAPAVRTMAVWTHGRALYPSAALWCASPLEHGSSVRYFRVFRASTDVISSASHENLDHYSDGCAAEPLSRIVAVKGCASAHARAATQPLRSIANMSSYVRLAAGIGFVGSSARVSGARRKK